MSSIDWNAKLEVIDSGGAAHPAATSVLCGERFVWQADVEDPALLLWDASKHRAAYFRDSHRTVFKYVVRNVPTVDDEGHTPTAHEPVKGVTLRECEKSSSSARQIDVDGEWAGRIFVAEPGGEMDGEITSDGSNWREADGPNTDARALRHAAALRAFRDRIRAERAAAKPAVVAWTFETAPLAVKIRQLGDRGRQHAARLLDDGGMMVGGALVTFDTLLRDYQELDGSPCGTPA